MNKVRNAHNLVSEFFIYFFVFNFLTDNQLIIGDFIFFKNLIIVYSPIL